MPTPKAEDTQQFSAEDVKNAGLNYRPRQRNNTPNQQSVAVQVTALLVIGLVFLALISGAVVTILHLTGR
jgi:hypothetical protein